jgi:uncharacterized protein YjbI with pentapeptide repeats
MQRVRLRFHLGPLDGRETREYIEHRLEVAGRETKDLFADECFATIHQYTGGVPRLVNTLCDSGLLCAFADGRDTVTRADIQSAIAELGWKVHESATGAYKKLREIERRDTEPSRVTRIEVLADGELVDDLTFEPGRIIVGRSPDNEIYIRSKFVSRHHAQLISDEYGCVIEDLNSTNGVFLGEKQVKKYQLRDGDVISVGVHELVYHDLRASASEEVAVDQAGFIGLDSEEPGWDDSDSEGTEWETADSEEGDSEESEWEDAASEEADAEVAEWEEADSEEADAEVAELEDADSEEADSDVAEQEDAESDEADAEVAELEDADSEEADSEVAELEDADSEEADAEVAEQEDADSEEADAEVAEREDADSEEADAEVAEQEDADSEEADAEVAELLVADSEEADAEVAEQEYADSEDSRIEEHGEYEIDDDQMLENEIEALMDDERPINEQEKTA